MPYKRSEKPITFNTQLSNEEMRVYSICNDLVNIEEILDSLKLSLDKRQIINALDSLVLKGLIIISPKKPQDSEPEIKGDDDLTRLYEKLKEALSTCLASEKAQLYINRLEACQNLSELRITARKIAIKLKLTMNTSVGKALLDLID